MKLPFVFLNVAMTADGKIASANHAIPVPGSPRDKAYLMELRTCADAVMSGARTVDLNPVHLGPGPAKYRHMRVRRGLAEAPALGGVWPVGHNAADVHKF